jgi:beta-galactosidase
MPANFFAYENEVLALKGKQKNSANFITLNGNWKFNWVNDASLRHERKLELAFEELRYFYS